jgi:AcrR family transcriptional regulator
MRADAARNRQLIMDTAHEVFTERGALAPLDAVARRAGLGIGTLYRHFPTREDLLLALVVPWTEEVELFCDEVVASAISPRTKLTRWLIEYVARVRVYSDCTAGMVGAMEDPSSPIRTKCEVMIRKSDVLIRSTARVLAACGAAVRGDVDALAVNRLAGGVAMAADVSELSDAAIAELLEPIIDGLMVAARPGKAVIGESTRRGGSAVARSAR